MLLTINGESDAENFGKLHAALDKALRILNEEMPEYEWTGEVEE